MPDQLPASEFGGKVQRNRVQPPPHVPTASERLMLTYTTGDESGVLDQDAGEVFSGVLPKEAQEAIMRDAGLLDKGQVWEEMQQD